MKEIPIQLALPGIGAEDVPLERLWPIEDGAVEDVPRSLHLMQRTQQSLLLQELAFSTQAHYRGLQSVFRRWTKERGLSDLPADDNTIMAFLIDQSACHKFGTLSGYLCAIASMQRQSGFDDPAKNPRIRELMAHFRKHAKKRPTRALTLYEVKRMLGSLGSEPLDKRDKALILIAFSAALKTFQIRALDRSKVAFLESGANVGTFGGDTFFFGRGTSLETCPVKALKDWLRILGTETGPLFPGVGLRGGFATEALGPDSISEIIRGTAKRAGIDTEYLTTHSLRTGFVLEAARRGVRASHIMHQARFKQLSSVTAYTGTTGQPFELEVELRRSRRARRGRRQT